MTNSEHLSQQQFLKAREVIAFGMNGYDLGATNPHNIIGSEYLAAEKLLSAGLIDVQMVLNTARRVGDLPRMHSVIDVPVPDQEMLNRYFITEHYEGVAHGVLIEGAYANELLGKRIPLNSLGNGWVYVYPLDAS